MLYFEGNVSLLARLPHACACVPSALDKSYLINERLFEMFDESANPIFKFQVSIYRGLHLVTTCYSKYNVHVCCTGYQVCVSRLLSTIYMYVPGIKTVSRVCVPAPPGEPAGNCGVSR